MKKNSKIISTTLIGGFFLLIAFASGEDKNETKKTSFSNCDELGDYVEYRGYQSLVEEWGEAEKGRIHISNEGQFLIDIKWNKIKVHGKTVVFTFTKDQTTDTPLTLEYKECY